MGEIRVACGGAYMRKLLHTYRYDDDTHVLHTGTLIQTCVTMRMAHVHLRRSCVGSWTARLLRWRATRQKTERCVGGNAHNLYLRLGHML